MKSNKWIRQIHRWLAIAFTVTVIVTFVALAQEKPVIWLSYVPLLPLALLLFTVCTCSCCRTSTGGVAGGVPPWRDDPGERVTRSTRQRAPHGPTTRAYRSGETRRAGSTGRASTASSARSATSRSNPGLASNWRCRARTRQR